MRNWKFNHIDFSTYPYYGGDDLGVRYSAQNLQVKVWAPTARQVELKLYKRSAGGRPTHIEALNLMADGVWQLALAGDFEGLYYTLRVNDGEWLNETPGVDARAVGSNGRRGLIFDPRKTDPEGWESDQPIATDHPVDAVLYELHVRDFSISPTSGMNHRGKFLAFTEKNTRTPGGTVTGINHLKVLGITHVHLLPVFDFFSVDENHPDDKYNWGYDPLNFNTPEGSFATNPDDTSRITEFKLLVQALHQAGIGVVMDVVYNHTGYTRRSWFNQTVPGYYYRQKSNGNFSNASGCGNEVATERAMVRKYIVDSLKYWASEFHLDGFRFDLMGIYDCETMNEIRRELDQLRPGMLLYGEGWAADHSPMDEKYRAVKRNVASLNHIACFNDDMRDAIKGNNFEAKNKGFVNGRTLNEEAVKFGVVAACHHPKIVYSYVESSHEAWAKEPWQCVNYVSCHDNSTLFDKLMQSCPDVSEEKLKKMQKLAAALILTSQGIPFLHGGSEFCRSKKGDHNSYKSSDVINQMDWNLKDRFVDVFDYFQKLMELRKAIAAFRMRSADEIRRHLHFSENYEPGVLAYSILDYPNQFGWKTIQLIFNARKEATTMELDWHKWQVVAREDEIELNGIDCLLDKKVSVPALSMMMLVKGD
ncbi:type I pullulanase [Sunxiuqinia sp. sy24]|uniref:type I pullulanase n=1 Tax=Sunxiuqinia sp. sy24 TaxID=3461495 RepID=UPI0040459497